MYCGVDEAGRGSVMGPLVVGAVFVESDDLLLEIGVKDSKKLTPRRRESMYEQLVSSVPGWSVAVASAADIDRLRKSMSLNDIELDMFCKAVSEHPAAEVIADCPDVNEAGFAARFRAALGSDAAVTAKHKADDTYPVVSAASIIAKVTRDRMMEEIRERFGTDVGSGYPSDRHTMDFIEGWIRENGRAPEDVRCSWEPVRVMLSRRSNTKISDW
ncbi:MAG: ribonuclease HII [Candidatus Methanomethylophilaceae archaeon]|nr:ribonuclease HII [Candidatus Methanomethylophilaceae archaeon]